MILLKQISLNELLTGLIDKSLTGKIYTKDGDGNFHQVTSVDLYDEKISCNDGWYQYFDSFAENFSEIYISEK